MAIVVTITVTRSVAVHCEALANTVEGYIAARSFHKIGTTGMLPWRESRGGALSENEMPKVSWGMEWEAYPSPPTKAKQRCVMGVGMCLYAQLVQTKNK